VATGLGFAVRWHRDVGLSHVSVCCWILWAHSVRSTTPTAHKMWAPRRTRLKAT